MGIGVGVYPQINLKVVPIMILAIQHRNTKRVIMLFTITWE